MSCQDWDLPCRIAEAAQATYDSIQNTFNANKNISIGGKTLDTYLGNAVNTITKNPGKLLDPTGSFGGSNIVGSTGLRDATDQSYNKYVGGNAFTLLDPEGFFSGLTKAPRMNLYREDNNPLGVGSDQLAQWRNGSLIGGYATAAFFTAGGSTAFEGAGAGAGAEAGAEAGAADAGAGVEAGSAGAEGVDAFYGGSTVDETVAGADTVDAGGLDYSTTGTQLDGDTVPTLSDTVAPTSDTVVPTDTIAQNMAGNTAAGDSFWNSIAKGVGAGLPGGVAALIRGNPSSSVPSLSGSRPATTTPGGNVYVAPGSSGGTTGVVPAGTGQGLFGNSSATVPLVAAVALLAMLIMHRRAA